MTHVKYHARPFKGNLNYFVDDLFSELPVLFGKEINKTVNRNSIPANVSESGTGYHLEIVAPGFEKTDFSINIDQDILTITAENKKDMKNGQARNIRQEYSYNSFKRSFTLDEKIDATKIEASYINGVLVLNLPKKEEVKAPATEITIK